MADAAPSPYVGPRPFEAEDSRHFFGRDLEIRQLASLVIARRIVLLHARSGAGKTSLLKAGLVPYLERRKKFLVLPVFRVEDVAGLPLADELASYIAPAADEARPRRPLLIVDQFEELFTRYDRNGTGKEELFLELQKCLEKNPRLSLVLSMREDYIAWLDSYAGLLPDRLRTRYRLDLLSAAEARAAIREPARLEGVEFTEEAAQVMVDDLRRVRVQKPDGSSEERLGAYVEPVQLQVVCHRLWQRVTGIRRSVEPSDIEAVGSVDRALADYYKDCVRQAAVETGLRERAIRDWIESELITEQGLRGQVAKAQESTEGLANPAIQALVDAHLLRAEERRDVTWFELAHDRLVGPVRDDNADWRERHLGEVERLAVFWDRQKRPPHLLLEGDALAAAEEWAADHDGELASLESDFIAASSQAGAARQRRQARRVQWLALTICAIVLSLAVLSVFKWIEAERQRDFAEEQGRLAEERYQEAEKQREISVANRLIVVTQSLRNQAEAADLRALLCIEATKIHPEVYADECMADTLRRAHEVFSVPHEEDVDLVAVSAGGTHLATASGETTRLWEIGGETDPIAVLDHKSKVAAATFSSDMRRLASVSRGEAFVWDLDSRKETKYPLPDEQEIESISFGPRGLQVAVVREGAVVVRNLSKGVDYPQVEVATAGAMRLWTMTARLDESGELLATAVQGPAIPFQPVLIVKVLVWKVTEAELVGIIKVDMPVVGVGFASGRDYLAFLTGQSRKSGIAFHRWDLGDYEELSRVDLDIPLGKRETVDVSADSKARYLITRRGRDRFWHFDGNELFPVGRGVELRHSVFSPDGGYLATTEQGTARLFRWPPIVLRELACAQVGRNLTYREWRRYMPGMIYRKTCAEFDLPSDLERGVTQMAEAGDPEAAGELLRELQEDYPKFATELTPAGLVASGLRRKIIRLSLNRATMDESLRALERYRFTFDRDLEEVTERDLNSICWNGSRHNFARDVLDVCELAVERAEKTLDPGTVASHRDSRGLARALTGDYVGAEEDFRYFLRDENNLRSVEVLELRREWVVRLDRGENPIDEKTLRKLLLRGD